MMATTYGVGEMILDAAKRGCEKVIIGIGGSATNDGGIGMLQAFGYQFLDKNRKDVGKGVAALGKVEMIIADKVNPLISKSNFRLLVMLIILFMVKKEPHIYLVHRKA